MHFSKAILSSVTMTSLAMALPANIAARGPGPVCIAPSYGCGTELEPKCCDPYDDTATETISPRGPGPVCIPPTYGCGTELKPKCCSPKEDTTTTHTTLKATTTHSTTKVTPTPTLESRATDRPCPLAAGYCPSGVVSDNCCPPLHIIPLSKTTSSSATTVTLAPRGPGPVCTHGTIGCGAELKPRCCTPEELSSLHSGSTTATVTATSSV